MRVLVTGANGFVGRALCSELLRQGHEVRAAVRSVENQTGVTTRYDFIVVGSVDEKTDWTEALSGIEVVIHLAARVHVMHDSAEDPLAAFRLVNTAGSDHLARSAANSGVRRLVYVSSIKVNGEETHAGQCYTELDMSLPQDPYGVSKWEAEQALQRIATETGLEVVIVRPPLVYGAGVKGNFIQMLRVLVKGIPLPLASVSNLRSLIYIGNFVAALLLCASHPAAAGQTYLVSDGEDLSTPDLLRQLGTALGRPARLLPCPASWLKLAGRLVGKASQMDRLLGSLQVDSGKIRRELDWHPPYTLSQGLLATAEWYIESRR